MNSEKKAFENNKIVKRNGKIGFFFVFENGKDRVPTYL